MMLHPLAAIAGIAAGFTQPRFGRSQFRLPGLTVRLQLLPVAIRSASIRSRSAWRRSISSTCRRISAIRAPALLESRRIEASSAPVRFLAFVASAAYNSSPTSC